MVVDAWIWIAFVAFILTLLSLDLFVFHREAHEVTIRESAVWISIWVSLALTFGVIMWFWQGPTYTGEYLAGYVIEWALSVDNMFVFAVLFTYFALPHRYQHRVLFWGIVGALVFRAGFIAAGAALLKTFHWMIFVFGAFLVLTAIRMARSGDDEVDPDKNPVLRFVRRVVPMTPDYRGQKFFVRENGRRVATPLLAVLIAVETTDVVFAIDSIPAIFGITKEPFIVFTSNAFAILGLRALYFLLAGMMREFKYLKLGLSVVLGFVGVKMLVSEWWKMPIALSLGVIALVLATSVIASLIAAKREDHDVALGAPETRLPAPGADGGSAVHRPADVVRDPSSDAPGPGS